MINFELLEQAFKETADDLLKKQIREWFVYTAPPEVHQIYKKYLGLLDEKINETRSEG